jgi:hypothetical protein
MGAGDDFAYDSAFFNGKLTVAGGPYLARYLT